MCCIVLFGGVDVGDMTIWKVTGAQSTVCCEVSCQPKSVYCHVYSFSLLCHILMGEYFVPMVSIASIVSFLGLLPLLHASSMCSLSFSLYQKTNLRTFERICRRTHFLQAKHSSMFSFNSFALTRTVSLKLLLSELFGGGGQGAGAPCL